MATPPKSPADLLGEFDLALVNGIQYVCHLVLRAYGAHQLGFPGSRETPEEPAGYEFSRVTLSATGEECEITMDDELEGWLVGQLRQDR